MSHHQMTLRAPRPSTASTSASYTPPAVHRRPTTTYATRRSYTASHSFGQEPPPASEMKWGMIAGWTAVVATGAGIFWAVTRSGSPRAVAANRRRKSSRRRSSRRRRVSRNTMQYKSISWGYVKTSQRWYVRAPNGNVRFFPKATAEKTAKLLGERYEMPVRRSDRKAL